MLTPEVIEVQSLAEKEKRRKRIRQINYYTSKVQRKRNANSIRKENANIIRETKRDSECGREEPRDESFCLASTIIFWLLSFPLPFLALYNTFDPQGSG